MDETIARILDDAYVADLAERPIEDVRAMRAECQDVETGLSYLRRVAQGRLEELRKLAGGGAIAFEVGADGDPDAIEAVLRRVPGVTDVSREPGDRPRWLVHSHQDVAAALTGALSAAGHSIDHLRRRGEDLLEIYRNLVPEERDGRIS